MLDKRAPEEYKNYIPEIVRVCENCMGPEVCWCGQALYKEWWKFVYEAVKNCKGI